MRQLPRAKPLHGDGITNARYARAFLLLFILSALVVLSVHATSLQNYTQLGTRASDYSTGTAFFGQGTLTPSLTGLQSVSFIRFAPLVQDVDSDGTSEIIVSTADSVIFYQNINLDAVGAVSLPSGEYSPPILYDIDGNGIQDVLIHNADTNNVSFIEWNGSTATITATHELPFLSTVITQGAGSMLGCRDDGICAVVGTQTGSSNWKAYGMTTFDNSGWTGHMKATNNASSTTDITCAPHIRHMEVKDYDGDGTDEFIFSSGSNGGAVVSYFGVAGSGAISNEGNFQVSANMPSGASNCDLKGTRFSSPYTADLSGASAGMETVIGYDTASNTFRMDFYKANHAFLDDHPETTDAEGSIISNLFSANIFHDTAEGQDVCAMGFDVSANQLTLLCASERTSQVPETYEFHYQNQLFNLTSMDEFTFPHLVHAIQTESSTTSLGGSGNSGTGTINPSEILTAYGIFRVGYSYPSDYDNGIAANTCIDFSNLGVHDCTLSLYYELPAFGLNASYIASDVQHLGRNDLIGIRTNQYLFYVDDGYSKTGCADNACLGNYTLNPCVQSDDALTNTTVEIRAQVADLDGDDVALRLQLYADTAQEVDSGWSANFTTGTIITRSVIANTSASGAVLRVSARDTYDTDSVETFEIAVNVNSQGRAYGACLSSGNINPSPDTGGDGEVPGNFSTDSADIVENSVSIWANFLGLSKALAYLLAIILVVFFIFIVGFRSNTQPKYILLAGLFLGFLLVLFGTVKGYLNASYLVVFTVIMAGIFAIWVWRNIASR